MPWPHTRTKPPRGLATGATDGGDPRRTSTASRRETAEMTDVIPDWQAQASECTSLAFTGVAALDPTDHRSQSDREQPAGPVLTTEESSKI
jgi:hypothetical protein